MVGLRWSEGDLAAFMARRDGVPVLSRQRPADPPAPPKQLEQDLQIQVAEFLDLALEAPQRWFHVPNGGFRTAAEAALFKAQGVKAGVGDVLILCPLPDNLRVIQAGFTLPAGARLVWIELKSEDGRLSTAQKDWRAWCELVGVPWYCCRSLEDVVAACADAGVRLRAQPT